MARPLNLSRLPKAGRLRAVNFKRTTPGSIERLIAPYTEPKGGPNPSSIIDASHPWARIHPLKLSRRLPCFRTPWLTVYAFPKALLGVPERRHQENTPFALARPTLYGEDGKVVGGRKSVNVSMMFVVGKKSVHKFSTIRNKVKGKIKSAVRLTVTRGAVAEEGAEKEKEEGGSKREVIVESGSDDGEKFVMQDWTYVFRPSLEVYRMPLPALLSGVQKALTYVNSGAQKLEYVWKLEAAAAARRPNQGSEQSGRDSTSSSSSSASGAAESPLVNGTRSRGSTQEDKKREWANSVSQVRALLKPYAKGSAEFIDDELLLNDEDGDGILASTTRRSGIARGSSTMRNDGREGDDEYGGPAAVKAIYSRDPILKPVDIPHQGKGGQRNRQQAGKERSWEGPRSRAGSGSGSRDDLTIRSRRG